MQYSGGKKSQEIAKKGRKKSQIVRICEVSFQKIAKIPIKLKIPFFPMLKKKTLKLFDVPLLPGFGCLIGRTTAAFCTQVFFYYYFHPFLPPPPLNNYPSVREENQFSFSLKQPKAPRPKKKKKRNWPKFAFLLLVSHLTRPNKKKVGPFYVCT